MKLKVLATCALLLVGVSSATAQDNFFIERMKGINGRQARSNPAKSFTNKKVLPPSFGNWNGNPNILACPKDDPTCVDEHYTEIKPGKSDREANVNFYGSMAGFAAGMNSEVHVDATIDKYLKGKLTLAYITMGLTEPAVAAGLAQTVNYIGNDVNNRLQGEQTFFSQLSYMPEISESLGQAYISCIAKAQSDEEMNWMAAQARCSGDTANLTAKKIEFKSEQDSGGISALNYVFDPYFDETRAGGADKDRTILLSEYLFQRDAESSDGETKAAGEKLRKAFQELIGDVEYTFDKAEAKKQGTRKLNYFKRAPTIGTSFEERLRTEAEQVVHAALLATFKQVCENPTASGAATAQQGDAFLRNQGLWIEPLSFPGFNPDSTLMRSLMELSYIGKGFDCNQYRPDGPYSYNEIVKNPDSAPEAGKDYIFLSQRIAFGRTYGVYIIAQQYIRRMNSGEFDEFARKAAFELLYEAAGSHDIQGVYTENTVRLREYLSYLGERTARRKQFMKAKGLPRGEGNGNEGSQQTSGPGTGIGGTD